MAGSINFLDPPIDTVDWDRSDQFVLLSFFIITIKFYGIDIWLRSWGLGLRTKLFEEFILLTDTVLLDNSLFVVISLEEVIMLDGFTLLYIILLEEEGTTLDDATLLDIEEFDGVTTLEG